MTQAPGTTNGATNPRHRDITPADLSVRDAVSTGGARSVTGATSIGGAGNVTTGAATGTDIGTGIATGIRGISGTGEVAGTTVGDAEVAAVAEG